MALAAAAARLVYRGNPPPPERIPAAMAEPSFADIRAVAAACPPAPTPGAGPAADPARAPAAWLGSWQGRDPPRLDRLRIALFAAAHGSTLADDPGALAETRARMAALVERRDPLADAAERLDADLRLYDLALDRPSADRRRGPALSEGEAARALAYGMMAVEDGLDLVLLGAVSAGADEAAAALSRALDGGADPLAALAREGGADIAALLGAVIAARMAGTPALALDAAAGAARRLAAGLLPGGAGHVAVTLGPVGLGGDAEAAVLALRTAIRRSGE
jgi:nicotinate-nucleotide--dimethylbenzimidazole phosphoribosyltransferase